MCEGIKEKTYTQNSIPLTENKLAILKEGINKGYIDVALHGNTHQTINEFFRSEFSGFNHEQQLKKIEIGKLFLEKKLDNKINTFIPPWNRYDITTLTVLEELQFSTISAGTKCVSKSDTKLNFLPNTCLIQDLESAIKVAGNNVKLGKEIIRGILEKTGIKTGIQNLIKEMIDMANQLLIDKGLFTSHIEKFSALIQNRRK